jgi:hypothetical protein
MIDHRNRVMDKFRASENAKADFAKNAEVRDREMSARQAQEKAQQQKLVQERVSKFQKFNSEAEEKYPQWFQPKEGDEIANKALERGKALADAVFGDSSKVDPEKLVQYHSAARMKVMGFDRIVAENSRLSKQLAEAQKALDGYKASGPGNATGKSGEKKTGSKSWESELDAMFQKR